MEGHLLGSGLGAPGDSPSTLSAPGPPQGCFGFIGFNLNFHSFWGKLWGGAWGNEDHWENKIFVTEYIKMLKKKECTLYHHPSKDFFLITVISSIYLFSEHLRNRLRNNTLVLHTSVCNQCLSWYPNSGSSPVFVSRLHVYFLLKTIFQVSFLQKANCSHGLCKIIK